MTPVTFRVTACAAAMAILPVLQAPAATYYVWTNSPAHGPGTSWDTAFRDIQSAVNAANLGGDTVVVTDGVYAVGSTAAPVAQSQNRVVVTNAITVRSVNGPGVTRIDGAGAVRCVYLVPGVVLSGFTLANGTASWTGYGGGAYAVGAVVTNCVIANCYASKYGGGAYAGAMFDPYTGGFYNCRFTGNSAFQGGGACSHVALYNCTVVGNSSVRGWTWAPMSRRTWRPAFTRPGCVSIACQRTGPLTTLTAMATARTP